MQDRFDATLEDYSWTIEETGDGPPFNTHRWSVSRKGRLVKQGYALSENAARLKCLKIVDPVIAYHEAVRLKSEAKPPEPPLFEALPKARQIPLLRGLDDCPGQQDLFDDMTAN